MSVMCGMFISVTCCVSIRCMIMRARNNYINHSEKLRVNLIGLSLLWACLYSPIHLRLNACIHNVISVAIHMRLK